MKCRIDKVWQSPGLAGAGIIFRSSGPEDIYPLHYSVGIYTHGAQWAIDHGGRAGNYRFAGWQPETHDIGQWYSLKLVVTDGNFLFYVDDKPTLRLRDRGFKGKFLGLVIGANIDASFDDFMITDQVDEDAFSEFDVSSKDMKLTTTWAGLKIQ